ncbi:T9SS type A sorting domain-containing protein [Flavobacterium aciduliphilum]|nr:T9SS type A sorting domain-containing protein [Flavobacterium aciduliphilum]
MKKIYLLFLFTIHCCIAQQTFTTYQAANLVVGQSTFTTTTSSCLQSGLTWPSYSAISCKGVLAIASQNGAGVRLWKTVYDANGKAADVVVGQSSFVCGTGTTQSTFNNANGVAFSPDGNKLLVSDFGNNRVLIWNSIPTSNGQPADVVLGQTSFTTNTSGVSSTSLWGPAGIFVSTNGNLFVSDRLNHRVLIWNSIPTTNATAADIVIGQPDFVSNSPGNGASNLNKPWGLWVTNDGKFLVADNTNHRVLIWNTIPTVNAAPADVVIGQLGFNSSTAGLGAASLYFPAGVTVSPDGKLAVGETGNNRILLFNSVPTTNATAANVVLGQASFTTNTALYPSGTATSQNFRDVYNVSFDLNGRLFVTGRQTHRVLVFGTLPTTQAELGITMSSNNNASCTGSSNQITVTVTNNSNNDATGVITSASFPATFSYLSHTASTGTYNPASGYWTIGTVPANSSVTLLITSAAGATGTYTASANILQSNQLDTNLNNNGISINYTISTITTASPTVSSQSFCNGATVANLNATGTNIQWYASNSGGLPLAASTVLTAGTYYATQTIGTCESARVGATISFPTKTWNGTSWDGDGLDPSNVESIVFTGDFTSVANIQGCSCTVNSGTVIIDSGHTLSLTNDLKVNGGTLTFNDGASLLQTNSVVNTGAITYKRTTSVLNNNYDFVYWSSPVVNQQLASIWMSSNGSTFYTFDPTVNYWVSQNGNVSMNPGIGYISRAFSGDAGWTPNNSWNSSFTGVPNNGDYAVSILKNNSFINNLIGNPYPSALDLERFYEDNNSVITPNFYFWTHNTPILNDAYTPSDYATYNAILGVGVGTGNGAITGGTMPDQYLDACQGFFAEALTTGTIYFKNTQRVSGNNNGFYKQTNQTTPIEKHCIWLNFTNTNGLFKQQLIDYAQGATNQWDVLYDAESFNGNEYADFYSLSGSKPCVIQSRALPFMSQDSVPLGYSCTHADTYSISIDHLNGLFIHQDIYLEDLELNQIHNLKVCPYTFTSTSGTFDSRFILRYENNALNKPMTEYTKGITTFPNPAHSVLNIESNGIAIDKIIIVDITGKKVWEQKDNVNQVDVKNFASGWYSIETYSEEQKFTSKFLKI